MPSQGASGAGGDGLSQGAALPGGPGPGGPGHVPEQGGAAAAAPGDRAAGKGPGPGPGGRTGGRGKTGKAAGTGTPAAADGGSAPAAAGAGADEKRAGSAPERERRDPDPGGGSCPALCRGGGQTGSAPAAAGGAGRDGGAGAAAKGSLGAEQAAGRCAFDPAAGLRQALRGDAAAAAGGGKTHPSYGRRPERRAGAPRTLPGFSGGSGGDHGIPAPAGDRRKGAGLLPGLRQPRLCRTGGGFCSRRGAHPRSGSGGPGQRASGTGGEDQSGAG